MLILRGYKIDEKDEIVDILKKEGIKDLDLEGVIFVALDDDALVGVAKSKAVDDKYYLEYLVIKKEQRNQMLGDSLLRAILSKLLNQGIHMIYSNEKSDYLSKKGFTLNAEGIFELNIADFFNKGCKHCGV